MFKLSALYFSTHKISFCGYHYAHGSVVGSYRKVHTTLTLRAIAILMPVTSNILLACSIYMVHKLHLACVMLAVLNWSKINWFQGLNSIFHKLTTFFEIKWKKIVFMLQIMFEQNFIRSCHNTHTKKIDANYCVNFSKTFFRGCEHH